MEIGPLYSFIYLRDRVFASEEFKGNGFDKLAKLYDCMMNTIIDIITIFTFVKDEYI